MLKIEFPDYSGIRVLMMPFIQGDASSLPEPIRSNYGAIIESTYLTKGEIGYLTIDESPVKAGKAQRAYRSTTNRAIHTEAGKREQLLCWGLGWGKSPNVQLSHELEILVASNVAGSTAWWDATVTDTTLDGDIGHLAHLFPYSEANILDVGEVAKLGVLTPHESLPLHEDTSRQFLRIVGYQLKGREPYFTQNPLLI